MRAAIFTGLALISMAGMAQAQVLVSDDFSYTGLLTANGWVNHSGSGTFINSDGNVATLSHGSGSREDVHMSYAVPRTATDMTFAAFDLNVPVGNPITSDANGTYFFHFWNMAFDYRTRTGVVPAAGGGDYGLAMTADSSSLGGGAMWATDLTFGTNYRIVIGWDANTNTGQLWVDPANSGSPSITHVGDPGNIGDLLEGIALRQGSDYTGMLTVDNVISGVTFADVIGGGPTTPGNAYCFGDGTGANCPCSAFGGAGEGCANTGGGGATLTGSGTALMSNDTFQLDIAGVPGAKPGLVLRGDNQTAAPAGDGILCTTGGSMRSQVQMTAAGVTTYTNFKGSGFGSVANLGTPTNFQFWYRDPSNPCSGGGFNFTNGWTVTYMP